MLIRHTQQNIEGTKRKKVVLFIPKALDDFDVAGSKGEVFDRYKSGIKCCFKKVGFHEYPNTTYCNNAKKRGSV